MRVQIVCLGLAILLGLVMVWRRVGAQEPRKAHAHALVAMLASASASAAASSPPVSSGAHLPASAAPSASAAPAPSASSDADAGDDQMETAVLGPDGGVPIHVEGPFRSPFANPDFGKAMDVRVGLVLNDITQYDIIHGTFVADFYLSLTSEREMPSMDLSFPNGNEGSKQVIADKPTFKLYRYTGTFNAPPDLRRYPFDEQHLEIQIEENTEGIDEIMLVPDQSHTHLEAGFEVIGWDVSSVEATSSVHDFPDRFDNDDLYYGRYTFSLGVQRFGTSATFTVYVPAFVIVLIALMGMWIGKDHLDLRTNAGAPMLAAAVLFHFALMQQLPAVSYLTRADKLMIGVYASLFINMLSTWCFFVVEDDHQDRVFRVARVVVPVVTVVVMALASTL
jgi:hypothetical protein